MFIFNSNLSEWHGEKKYAWISIGMWTLVKQPKLYKVDIFSNVNEHALNMNGRTEK